MDRNIILGVDVPKAIKVKLATIWTGLDNIKQFGTNYNNINS